MQTYLEELENESIEDLLMARFCPISLPDSTRQAHALMPELLNTMLDIYEQKGRELINYAPPDWINGMYDDD